MNRMLLPALALLSAATPLVVDSALKGAVLLSAALLSALLLWRASAATRHLVWLVAVLALLAIPLLSLVLPGWRVLPAWAVPPVVAASAVPGKEMSSMPHKPHGSFSAGPAIAQAPPSLAAHPEPTSDPAPAALPVAVPSPAAAPVALTPPAPWWRTALPSLWSAGCAALLLRLLGAHWLLRRAARRAQPVTDGPLAAALAAAASQLGVTQRVRLLVEEKRTIPVVWGVWRSRLMLPTEAVTWDEEQLQSVLLHELAHIRRRDTLVQWLTQLACTLHWFNPLVWLAAWRLHVERERACDDMVLASGVKPSAYAGHLLSIASQLSPARWTSACGLAMARKPALEGRLHAVLSEKLNRRSVTAALAAIALILGAGIAIPVAMLRAAEEKWNPPSGAHIGTNDFSAYCVHDGKDTSFVIAYHGFTGSSSAHDSNPKTRTWTDSGTLTAKNPGIALSFHRTHITPGKLSTTTAPAEARDLSKPAPAPRDFGQKEYDLAKGRVFLLTDSGLVRQLDLPTPIVTDQESSKKLAALIAAIPPQEREAHNLNPNHQDAVALYEIWQRHARLSGEIPGALIGELAAAVKVFIGYNPTWETVPKLKEILPRLDATHDWKPGAAIALLNEVAAVQDSPLQTAAEKLTASTISQGKPLPENFANVAWGETQPNGLRAAWVLEPDAAEHRMGTALKARLLVQNTGKLPVMVRVPTWHQGQVSARNAEGAEVQVSGIDWTTIARLVPVLLGPGHFIEINAPGVGLGQDAGRGPWAGPRVGSHVLAKDGTELTLTHGPLALDGSGVGMREDAPHLIGPGWWQAHIKARLAREFPLPASGAKRTHLLDRAVRELFASTPTADEINAFATDPTDGAFDALVQRLAARADVVEFAGSLPTAPVKFRVLPVDPAADKTPRVVLGPGEYPLSGGTAEYGAVMLKIVGRPVGDRRTNDAELLFEATEATGKLRPDPHKLEIPDGWGTWAIVCRPGEGTFYLLHKGGVQKIDYTHPRQITDTLATDLPAEFRDEVKRQFDIAAPTAPAPKSAEAGPRADDAALQPKHESAQSLFRKWQANSRTDGKIPGALIGQLARTTDDAVKQTNDANVSAKLAALRPRLDASRDWTQADVVALLDDLTAIATAPVSWTDTAMEFSSMRVVRQGEPLPAQLESAAWGAPAANGLRAAWLLEPAPEVVWTKHIQFLYRLGTVLKARVLFHNTGKEPVVFETETWHQDDHHSARDAKGAEIPVKATWFTGITPTSKFRLAPGEYCEVSGHGIAIGAGEYPDEHSTGAVGAIIEAKEGETVTLSHSVDAGTGGWTQPNDHWLATIAGRVANEAPMPASAADREQLIRRVTLDIFGVAPTAEEIAAFTADNTPDALAKLTARLQTQPRIEPFTGKLPTGETKFRVLAADPNAAKAPRTATAPGRYVLSDVVHLQITQTNVNPYRAGSVPFLQNKATIIFLASDPSDPRPYEIAPPKPCEIELPAGEGAYAFAWVRDSGELWLLRKAENFLWRYRFAADGLKEEGRYDLWPPTLLSQPLRRALQDAMGLRAATDIPPLGDEALEQPEPGPGPQKTAKLKPGTEERLSWGAPVNGLRGALVRMPPETELTPGAVVDLNVVVQNVSDAPVRLRGGSPLAHVNLKAVRRDGTEAELVPSIVDVLSTIDEFTLQPREVAVMSLMSVGIGKHDANAKSAHGRSIGYWLPDERAVTGFKSQLTFTSESSSSWSGSLAAETPKGTAAKLKLELYGRQKGQQEVFLTRDVEAPVSNETKSATQPKAGAKLDRTMLEGTWEGEKDGVTIEVEFQWLSEHQQVRWEVKRPSSYIATEMSVVVAPDGNSAELIFRKGLEFEATQGRVTPGEAGTLNLEIIPNPNVSNPGYPAVKGLVLKPQKPT